MNWAGSSNDFGRCTAREVPGELEAFLGKKNAEALVSLRETGDELIWPATQKLIHVV